MSQQPIRNRMFLSVYFGLPNETKAKALHGALHSQKVQRGQLSSVAFGSVN